jgi:plastocyanin
MRSGDVFAPKAMTIPRGGTVRVTNRDLKTHNWTDPGIFSSGDMTATSMPYSFRFTYTGTYQFECTIHSGMTGSVTVT